MLCVFSVSMPVKIIVPHYPIDTLERDDWFKICADATGGEIVSVQNKGSFEIIKNIFRQDIHAHGRGFPFPELSCLFAKRSIYTPHFNTLGSSWLTRLVRKYIWNHYTKVIAQTEYGKRSYIESGINPEKIEVLPIPIDYGFWSKPKGGDAFRKKYNPGKEPFAICIGIRKGKNVDVIAKACKKADIKLVAVGFKDKKEIRPGNEFLLPPKEYMEFGNVIYTGFISSKELLAALDAATIFINSSESSFECFCISAYQAAAAGVPLCLPDFGVFEAFKDHALFHNNHDSDKLADNIKAYLNNEKLARQNAEVAKIVAAKFDYDIVKEKFVQLYKSMGIF